MTKEQAKIEFMKIIDESNKEADEIIRKAKENGTWQMGLDSNNKLFAELDKRTIEKINSLKAKIDE